MAADFFYFSGAWVDWIRGLNADAFAPAWQKPQNTDEYRWAAGLMLGAIPPGLMEEEIVNRGWQAPPVNKM